MAECVVCGESVPVSDACRHCARPVCDDHREPPAHDCPGVESDSRVWYTDPDAGRDGRTGGRELSNPRRLAAGVAVAVLVALVVGGILAAGGAPALDGVDDERLEALVVAEVNDARTARGHAPLEPNASLAAVADAHSADMAARDYVNHTAPNGSGVAERYERFGIDCFGSENIYYTPNGALLVSERTLAERVVAEWLDSPGHRETLLGNFSRQGIGVVVAGDGGVYVTQNVC
ncbi:CAP domain-containing protein [Halosegnis marinus]|uniref:CAP domain-containing protein n=1 Tax=Halosegnis marinus TaxID=3034023 RepID=A0ABD5ZPS3_9EURY|nr:CAP domain-containing protein [Halosegnis sp. DT85]